MPPGRCHPVPFPSSPEADQIQWWGGGVVAEIVVTENVPLTPAENQLPSIRGDLWTFPGHLEVTSHLWTLTEVPGHLAGLLTHSKNVTASIHCRKKTFTKSWGGGHGPRGPPGYATGGIYLSHNTPGSHGLALTGLIQ